MPSISRKIIVALFLFILAVFLLGLTMRDSEKSLPEKFLGDAVGVVQNITTGVANGISGFFESLDDIRNTYEENQHLKEELEDQAKLEAEIYELEQQVEELEKQLEIESSLSEYETIDATVIQRSSDMWMETLVINVGSSHGVEEDMAVVTSDGLIGKVESTTGKTSTVKLLTTEDPTFRVSAEIQDTQPINGYVQGYDPETGCLLLKDIPISQAVTIGSTVVTSGLGGVFPKGLPIGEVQEVIVDDYGLTQTALVKPYADFNDIDYVKVIDRTAKEVETNDGEM